MGEKWVENVFFPKVTLDYWGCTNKCLEPILSPF